MNTRQEIITHPLFNSGLWHAILNGTTYRAYMMERYMNPERIPGKFKWGVVIKTAEWVLENCEEHKDLKNKILKEMETLLKLMCQ